MLLVDKAILVGGILMVLAILSSKLSSRAGLPVLVVFLVLGMLAGSEGPGGIPFDNYKLAHAIGTVALALILFDGGLHTPFATFRLVWKPAALLATVGVVVTSAITGVVAAHVLGVSLLEGMLLGAVVGSTDAAAVFSILRGAGISLRKRLSATLEVESGSNDPMAIFLTVGLLEVLVGNVPLGPKLLQMFALQMGVGLVAGLLMGRLAVILVNRINLASAGLYPLLTSACGMLAFGLAALAHGSGFLAIYVAGIILGNSKLTYQRGTLLFHDGLAWAAQITMFVVLGLLSYPSELIAVSGPALLVSAALIFVARPLAVLPILLPFGFKAREALLVSWVGLKGAVPIILAIFPLLFGLPSGHQLFNVVFFVVLVSAIVQGGTLSPLARLLKLQVPPDPEPPMSLEITSLRDVDAAIVDYPIDHSSRAAGHALSQLALPKGAVVAMIFRGSSLIPPGGSTQVLAGDHVFVVLREQSRAMVDKVFGRGAKGEQDLPNFVEFPLRGSVTAGTLAQLYDIQLSCDADTTLNDIIQSQRPEGVEVGDTVPVGQVALRVREMVDGSITFVGLVTPTQPDSPADGQ